MGLIHAEIKLDNPKQSSATAINTQALVDTGALHLCIPEALSRQLNLSAERFRRVTFADGRSVEAPYVGPVRVEAMGRTCFVGAMVFGDEVLLGVATDRLHFFDLETTLAIRGSNGGPAANLR